MRVDSGEDVRTEPFTSWLAVLFACILPIVMGSGGEVLAEEIVLPCPGAEGWEPFRFPGISAHTLYRPISIEGRLAIHAESHCSASALLYRLEKIDLHRTPLLRWEWKVEQGLDIVDHRVKAGDDFAARVYVLFEIEPERLSAWERVRRRLASALFRVDLPGSAINYVWSSREPAGARWRNPYTAWSLMISLGAGPLGSWRSEEVDVLADYQAMFSSPPRVLALALMSDSDDSCQQASATLAHFRFASRTEGEDP